MSVWTIAWSYLWNRKVTTSLTILSVGLGVALIASVLTLRDETRKRFEEEGRAWDIVVGAKGSPLQLVLSAVYFMDLPPGNIMYADYLRLLEHEDVDNAYPIGLGDTIHGGGQSFRIVGTKNDLFDYNWPHPITLENRDPFKFEEGSRRFEQPMEAVLGSTVAQLTKMKVGDTFVGAHGLIEGLGDEGMHDDQPFTVSGILEPSGTPFDRSVLVDIESIWHMHEEHHEHPEGEVHDEEAEMASREVTAVLIHLSTPAARFQFLEHVNDEYNAMAAIPVNEVTKLYNQFLGAAKTVLLAVAYLVVVVSAISIMIGLYLSILQRKRDLAIMRALGASAPEIFSFVLIEALLVTLLGVICGWIIGGGVSWGLGIFLTQKYGLDIAAFTLTLEHIVAFGTVSFVGLLAGILPGWQAYRTDVAASLADL